MTPEERERYMQGVDEEAAWMHGAPMGLWLEMESLTEPDED